MHFCKMGAFGKNNRTQRTFMRVSHMYEDWDRVRDCELSTRYLKHVTNVHDAFIVVRVLAHRECRTLRGCRAFTGEQP